jgi:hypothetical protein
MCFGRLAKLAVKTCAFRCGEWSSFGAGQTFGGIHYGDRRA